MKTAVCLYARDEERDIAEWLAYQRAIGFDAAIVYDNGSADRTAEIVRAAGRHYDVRLIDWPDTQRLSQLGAYADAIRHFGREFDWMAFLDADEFLLPATSLHDLLDTPAAAIALNWRMFGSAGLARRPADGLLIETFTRRAPDDFGPNRQIKSIVRPSLATPGNNPHAFKLAPGSYATASGQPVEWHNPGATTKPDYDGAAVHHYFTKSRAEWEAKVARGYRDGTKRDITRGFEVYDRNEVEDHSAARFAPAVHATLCMTTEPLR